MSRWKTLTTSWWTKNLFEIACATMVVALLVGGIAFAIVQAPAAQVVQSRSVGNDEDRSGASSLSPIEETVHLLPEDPLPVEDEFEIVCLPDTTPPARGDDQFAACSTVSAAGEEF